MNPYFVMVFEILFGFLALFVLTKVLGKSQISQITTFDFISALVLGELVGNALFDKEAGIIEITIVIVVWGVLMYVVEWITQKVNRSRSFLEGRPAIIIHHGKLIRESMKKNKLDINQLQHLLRSKDAFSVSEVEYAVMETDGTVSVLKKSTDQTPTRQDMQLTPKTVRLPYTLVIDGEIMKDNLDEFGRNEKWLMGELKQKGYERIEDVFYAEWTPQEKLFVQDGKGLEF